MSTSDTIFNFIVDEFAQGRKVELDTPLLGDFVDSVGTFILVEFLEREFSIQLSDADLTVTNLNSVNTLSALVERMRAGGRSAKS